MDGVPRNSSTPIAAFLTLTRAECKACEECLALESNLYASHDEANEDAIDRLRLWESALLRQIARGDGF